MLGIICALSYLFETVRDAIKDTVEDIQGRSHRRVGSQFYVKGTKLMDERSGHQVFTQGDHKYVDLVTREQYRSAITYSDLSEEERAKEWARQHGCSVYRISSARLPANVEGAGYKDFNSNRMYVLRKVKKKVIGKYPKVTSVSFLLFSINSDNYGKAEKFSNGKLLTPQYVEAFGDRKIDLSRISGDDNEFGWEKF